MQFNLIDERWIPVIRQDGTPTMITPWEVSAQFAENPVMKLNAPRADFNGALIQFFIGLIQTVAAPKSKGVWRKQLITPPSPDELKGVPHMRGDEPICGLSLALRSICSPHAWG